MNGMPEIAAVGLPESETGAAALLTDDDRVSRSCLERAATAGATTATASAVIKRQSIGSRHFDDEPSEVMAAPVGPSSITEALGSDLIVTISA